MPAVSKKQKRLMDAAAHSPAFAKKVGIPMSVAKDYSESSKGMKFRKGGETMKNCGTKGYAKGGLAKRGAILLSTAETSVEAVVSDMDNLMTATLGDGNSLSVPMPSAGTRELKSGQEFYPQRFSASGSVTAKVVFAGFGITAPKWNYDDYKDGVRGSIVMILDHEPGERDPNSPFEGIVTAEPAAAWRKALAAQDKGAVGIIFVSDVHNHPDPANFEQAARNTWPDETPRLKSYMLASWADRIRIPAIQVSPALAASQIGRASCRERV